MPTLPIELLQDGKVEEFNASRERRGTLDLFAADLSNLKLHGVDLSGVNLQKADLTNTDLSSAVLARADLSGADLTGANLSGAMAIRSRWKEAFLGEANLSDAELNGADFSDADLTGADATGARMSGVRLKGATLKDTNFSNVDLAESKLPGVDLSGVNLTGAVLRDSDLSRANLNGAKLDGADLSKARLAGATLKGASMVGAKLESADLTAADLTGAKVGRADFTRADLTEAVLDGVDKGTATFTFSEAAPAPEEAPVEVNEPVVPLRVEEPSLATSGDHVALLWENEEPGGGVLRLLVAKLDAPAPDRALRVPVPADLALSRTIVPAPNGFTLVALVERPGGLVVNVADVGFNGRMGPMRSMKLGYTAAVRPIVRAEGGSVLIYGISREGPGLQVHKLEGDALVRQHASAMATVRGFAGAHHPVVLSKGGVLVLLGAGGPGQPMRAPAGFPGRSCAAAPRGTGLVLTWAESEKSGFSLAFVKPGEAPDEMRLLPKLVLGAMDMTDIGGKVWVVFTREDPRGRAPSTAHAVRLPDGSPFTIVDDKNFDAEDVRFCLGTGAPLAAVTGLDGSVRLYALDASAARERWRMG